MNTRRAFLTEPGKFKISELDVHIKPKQVLVKVAACGLCNWELNFWKGLLVYGGYPQALGHEWAGTVVEAGAEVKSLKAGDPVTGFADAMVGFSDYLAANEDACCKLGPATDPKYAMGEPLKCILTVLRGAVPEAGDYGVIQGCGPMGLWCVQALSGNMLAGLIAIDIDDAKLELAKKFGATHTINSKKENVQKNMEAITKGHMADFLIEGTGIPALLNTAQKLVRSTGRGRLVLMSSHEEICREFDFREAIGRSLQIIVAHPAYTASQMDDLRRAVLYLDNGVFKVKELVSHEFKLEDIQKAFETLENKPAGYMKGVVVP